MPNFYASNRDLTTAEMQNNAAIIYDTFTAEGWTPNAVCAMLGNMQLESTINPGRWENGAGPGFGLTQWTPASKLQDYIRATFGSTEYDNGYYQMARIRYEVEHPGVQWLTTTAFPLTFPQFTKSTESLRYLVETFERNYERGTPLIDTRTRYAQYWWDYLTGRPPVSRPPVWLLFKMTERM